MPNSHKRRKVIDKIHDLSRELEALYQKLPEIKVTGSPGRAKCQKCGTDAYLEYNEMVFSWRRLRWEEGDGAYQADEPSYGDGGDHEVLQCTNCGIAYRWSGCTKHIDVNWA